MNANEQTGDNFNTWYKEFIVDKFGSDALIYKTMTIAKLCWLHGRGLGKEFKIEKEEGA